jgi:excisionase family DNA binding protein
MSEKRCYTVKELQAMLGVSRPSVYELLKKNVFRSFIVGGKHIISKSSLDEWLDRDSQAEERSRKVMDF